MTEEKHLVQVDKDYWDCPSIDTELFLKTTTDSEIELPDDKFGGWLMEHDLELAEHVSAIEGQAYSIVKHVDNTYNSENQFSSEFQYVFFVPEAEENGDWYYSDDVYLGIEIHKGGDVRGNYGEIRLFKMDSPAETHFFDWVVGWNIFDAEGERLEGYPQVELGYSSWPTGELRTLLESDDDLEFCEEKEMFKGKVDGEEIYFAPYHYAEYNV